MDEQIGTTKRGPGRPRKVSHTFEPVSALPSVINIDDIARDVNKSPTGARRMLTKDPLSPAPFKLNNQDHWLREDWNAYLRMKARLAQEAKQAKLAERAAGEPNEAKEA